MGANSDTVTQEVYTTVDNELYGDGSEERFPYSEERFPYSEERGENPAPTQSMNLYELISVENGKSGNFYDSTPSIQQEKDE